MKNKLQRIRNGLGALCATAFMAGCRHMPLLDPKGPIGDAQRQLIIITFGLMLIVVVPVFILVFWFTRKYRASNTRAAYAPKWSYSAGIDGAIWLVPVAIVIVLAYFTWTGTFRLDPYKPIASAREPLTIEVVSLDWKWLFIYPEQGIAVVNQLVFPANVPLSFRLTSDSVMTSFFIPRLGSQMYAMAGMQTRLNLMAGEPGVYTGHNQEFSGRGYADMHFKAIATTSGEFQAWMKKVRQSPDILDAGPFRATQETHHRQPGHLFLLGRAGSVQAGGEHLQRVDGTAGRPGPAGGDGQPARPDAPGGRDRSPVPCESEGRLRCSES